MQCIPYRRVAVLVAGIHVGELETVRSERFQGGSQRVASDVRRLGNHEVGVDERDRSSAYDLKEALADRVGELGAARTADAHPNSIEACTRRLDHRTNQVTFADGHLHCERIVQEEADRRPESGCDP